MNMVTENVRIPLPAGTLDGFTEEQRAEVAAAGEAALLERVAAARTRLHPAEFWQHGYRTGYKHCASGWPSLLDDDWETGEPLDKPLEISTILAQEETRTDGPKLAPSGDLASLIAREREAAAEYRRAAVEHRTVLLTHGTKSTEYEASFAAEDAAMLAMIDARVAVDAALAAVAA